MGRRDAAIFTRQDMVEGQPLSVAGGDAVVYTARAPGRERSNEDGAGLLSLDGARGVLAVADGLGGHPAGEDAAVIALRCLLDALTRLEGGAELRPAILDGLDEANRAVIELGVGAATTLAIAEISSEALRPYHVGDCAILVVGQRGKIKLQTVSHSPVGYAIEAGLLDEDDEMHHRDRHLISNLLGAPDMRIEVGSRLRLAPRDTVLLATDGLFDNLNVDEIVEIIRSEPLLAVSARLAHLGAERMCAPSSEEPSKPDDLTFILFRLRDRGRGAH